MANPVVASISANLNSVPVLDGANFKDRKENMEIVLGCMDLDLALRIEKPPSPMDSRALTSAKEFLAEIEKCFAKSDKAETSTLLQNLISMKYQGKGNFREYIMGMSNIAPKLKALKLELSEDLLIHLVLIFLPSQFSQFKISYNCQKEKWSLNELISYYVQEEERLKQERTESADVVSTSKDKGKRKRIEEPKMKLLRVQDKRNKIRVTTISFAVSLDM
ncbi:uncharacterized protein LOC114381593 [Glycine soja]|uniref:uncharacterized protein LOC114381593 n=1 Tax=Glycine soja TaxID=3848 RepID=UPI00103B754E|nr:uncharacterized protein LOC114381593 [Glycine soja]